MKESTIKLIDNFFAANPIAKGQPVSEKEINNAEKKLGIKFDKDYISFLRNYGGSVIKATEIYGFRNSELLDDTDIIEITTEYREENSENNDWLVIGSDYAGNPVAININGNIITYDHDSDEEILLADTFEDYILISLTEE